MDDLSTLATEPFCYLTTTGRGSGRPHTIELWFALHDARVYLLSGGGERSDWVKNLQREPAPGYAGDLRGWREASLPVAIDLEHRPRSDFEFV